MSDIKHLSDLDLAALVASRICHDVVGPVGAIFNGLEVLEDDDDEQVKQYAMDVIRRNTKAAWARLEFARLAYGAAGSSGTEIPVNKLQELGNAILEEKHKTNWTSDLDFLPKGYAKLLLNLLVVSVATVPRGGQIDVVISGDLARPTLSLTSNGDGARCPERVPAILKGEHEGEIDALVIQPYFTHRLLADDKLTIEIETSKNQVKITVI